MKEPFKLLIGVPCMDYLHVEFVKSLNALTTKLCREGVNFSVEISAGSLIYFARNRMANKAINEGYTHLLFIDSDMVFDENIVETLQFCGKDFVCGIFQARRSPYGCCASFVELRRVKNGNHFVCLLNHDLVEQRLFEVRRRDAVLQRERVYA